MKYTDERFYKTDETVVEAVPELDGVNVPGFVRIFNQQITISAPYWWNGASFILFYWFGTPDRWMVPSLIHDALCDAMRKGRWPLNHDNRKLADGIFYRLLRERGVSWLVARIAYLAVRFGSNYAIRHGARVKEVA